MTNTPKSLLLELAEQTIMLKSGSVSFEVWNVRTGLPHTRVIALPSDEKAAARAQVEAFLRQCENPIAIPIQIRPRDEGGFDVRCAEVLYWDKPLASVDVAPTDPSYDWWSKVHESVRTQNVDASLKEGHFIKYARSMVI